MRKECQTMYNNYEMAKTDLDALNVKMEQARITLKKVEELDASKDVYCAYGCHCCLISVVGSMYMLQDHKATKEDIEKHIKELSAKIESVAVIRSPLPSCVEAGKLLREALQRLRGQPKRHVV